MVLNPHDFHCLNMHDIVTTVDAVKKTFGSRKIHRECQTRIFILININFYTLPSRSNTRTWGLKRKGSSIRSRSSKKIRDPNAICIYTLILI